MNLFNIDLVLTLRKFRECRTEIKDGGKGLWSLSLVILIRSPDESFELACHSSGHA